MAIVTARLMARLGIFTTLALVGLATSTSLTQASISSPQKINSYSIAQAANSIALTDKDIPGFIAFGLDSAAINKAAERLNDVIEELGLDTEKVKPENVFLLYKGDTVDRVLMGFTVPLSAKNRQIYDKNVKNLQKPSKQQEVLRKVLVRLEKEMAKLPEEQRIPLPEINGSKAIAQMNSFANASAGARIDLDWEGTKGRLDLATFRRNNTGVVVAVGYFLEGGSPSISVEKLATMLDERVKKFSGS